MSKPEIPVKEIGELLDTVSSRVPDLISKIKATLYSVEAARDLGLAVGTFYNELIKAGIPADKAQAMASEYMGTLGSAVNRGLGRSEIKMARGECRETEGGRCEGGPAKPVE